MASNCLALLLLNRNVSWPQHLTRGLLTNLFFVIDKFQTKYCVFIFEKSLKIPILSKRPPQHTPHPHPRYKPLASSTRPSLPKFTRHRHVPVDYPSRCRIFQCAVSPLSTHPLSTFAYIPSITFPPPHHGWSHPRQGCQICAPTLHRP